MIDIDLYNWQYFISCFFKYMLIFNGTTNNFSDKIFIFFCKKSMQFTQKNMRSVYTSTFSGAYKHPFNISNRYFCQYAAIEKLQINRSSAKFTVKCVDQLTYPSIRSKIVIDINKLDHTKKATAEIPICLLQGSNI